MRTTSQSRDSTDAVFSKEALFELLKRISRGIAETFGTECEVIVHDLANPSRSIIHIDNGHVTGRRVGDGIRDLAAILRSKRFGDDALCNYLSETADGKTIKSMTVIVRDEKEEICGALCINLDLSALLSAKAVLERTTSGFLLNGEEGGESSEAAQDVLGILDHIIDRTVAEYGVPVSRLTRTDKLRIVQFLDEREAFLIRGAVDRVANKFDVSRYTIYNYLEEVRAKQSP